MNSMADMNEDEWMIRFNLLVQKTKWNERQLTRFVELAIHDKVGISPTGEPEIYDVDVALGIFSQGK
jgi:hypothetical protein